MWLRQARKTATKGLDDLPEIRHAVTVKRLMVLAAITLETELIEAKQNFHPTVKPTALMEYLIRLVTPAGGVVLDPFTGSGSTGKAALLNGYKFIGCELTPEYLPIIEGRLKHAAEQYAAQATEKENKESETLF
jgi:site-specific DNA-methyltransferase (adenine-specific)